MGRSPKQTHSPQIRFQRVLGVDKTTTTIQIYLYMADTWSIAVPLTHTEAELELRDVDVVNDIHSVSRIMLFLASLNKSRMTRLPKKNTDGGHVPCGGMGSKVLGSPPQWFPWRQSRVGCELKGFVVSTILVRYLKCLSRSHVRDVVRVCKWILGSEKYVYRTSLDSSSIFVNICFR